MERHSLGFELGDVRPKRSLSWSSFCSHEQLVLVSFLEVSGCSYAFANTFLQELYHIEVHSTNVP